MDDPQDAQRWLYVHEGEIIGAGREAAVALILEAGMTAEVTRYHGRPSEAPDAHPDRVRLFIGDDGKVRTADSG
jgi:hypothetical protein